jgi:hypothetical protein
MFYLSPGAWEEYWRMTGWRARLDWIVMVVGAVIAHVSLFAQLAGFAFAFLFDDPITGDLLLDYGFWVAGLGGAGLVYGLAVDAGGSVAYPGGPLTYTPPKRRWPVALYALAGTPLWAGLSLPLGIMCYGVLLVGFCVIGCLRVLRLIRHCS